MRNLKRHKNLLGLIMLVLLLCLDASQTIGQEKGPKTEPVNSQPKPAYITMNFKDVDLQVFIKFISELTGKNFLIDPNVKGTVTVISPQKVTVDEVYKVFLSVLEVNGFTLIEAGHVSKVVPTAAAKTKATETFLERKLRTPEDKIVTQLVPLKHAEALVLGRLLASLVEKTGLLVPYAETNTLIVIDTMSNINRLVRIITELDVPGDEEIWVTQLRQAKADDLAKKLATLFQERRGATAGQQPGTVRADLKILPDERTNSLVVLAGPNPMAKVKLLVDKLDQRQVRPRENIHIYSLQNAVAETLAKVLMEIPGKGTKDEKVKAAPVSKDVQISADKSTNTLVIIAEPEEYAILEEVIKKLDESRTMVYVEALIVEVSMSKALELGVEWRVGNTYDGGYSADSSGGLWFGGSRGGGSAFADTFSSPDAAPSLPAGFFAGVIGKGITLGNITFPSIAAFIRAVKTDSDFNILSTPQIMTLDNEEASIEVGQNIPFVTQVDQGTDVTSRAIQNFQYKDVGVTLKVTPIINDEGFIRLKIEESVKNVVSQTALSGTVLAPTTTYRTAKTSITVRDTETAVIGGLIETRMDRGTTQTPCLGGVPALGWLFKTANDQDQKINLMVFLTPHVVRNSEEARQLYGKKKEYMQKEGERATKVQEKEIIRKKAFNDDWGFGEQEDTSQKTGERIQ